MTPKNVGLMKIQNWVGSHCHQKCFTMDQNLAIWMIKRVALIRTFIQFFEKLRLTVMLLIHIRIFAYHSGSQWIS